MARARCVGNAPCAQRLGGALAPRTGRLGRSESAQTAQNASLGPDWDTNMGHGVGCGPATFVCRRVCRANVCDHV